MEEMLTDFSDMMRFCMDKKKKYQVRCPYCGYKMPVFYDESAEGQGIHVACKGRNCKRVFELRIKQGKQQIK